MLKQQVYKIEMIRVNDIKPAGFNPASRMKASSLEKLEEAIKRAGEIISPLVVSKDGFILDGHGRWLIAKRLGWDFVPCIVVPYGLQEGWTILNGGTRPLRPKDYLQAVAQGLDNSFVQGDAGKHIRVMQRIIGEDGIQNLAAMDVSPGVIKTAQALGRYLGDTSDGTLSVLVGWIVKHKMSFFVRRLNDLMSPPSLIWAAIEEDRPLELK